MVDRIVNDNRDTVGEHKKEGKANRVCDEGVAPLLPGSRIFPADLGDVCTVDLVCTYGMGRVYAKCSTETGKVFEDAFTLVPATVAEIQAMPGLW